MQATYDAETTHAAAAGSAMGTSRPVIASNGSPQPGSQPVSRETADWYAKYTANQLRAFQHDNGHWYLYAAKPDRPDIGRDGTAHAARTATPRSAPPDVRAGTRRGRVR